MTGNRRDHNRNRFVGLAMVTVFDIAGPLVAYSLLRSAKAGEAAEALPVAAGHAPAEAEPATRSARPAISVR
jgi:hypothetical protein